MSSAIVLAAGVLGALAAPAQADTPRPDDRSSLAEEVLPIARGVLNPVSELSGIQWGLMPSPTRSGPLG
ncbi:hypothetical protein AB0D04_41570 [Streptomyces sp. NPDC048483]|uniref:hypothetical protein n=1 Tax=Streptomyces sp. NPDC048483 TaxID=3154927 RepID=UPI00342382DB